MSTELFNKLDLNLIKIFFVLYQELNTTKAAERLHLSQPAVSRSLQKLRDAFNDPLFVRAQHGLKATEKAELLASQLPPIWNELADCINFHNQFTPKLLTGTLRCAFHPSILSEITKELFVRIHNQAPNVQLVVSVWDEGTAQSIVQNEIDFGVSLSPISVSKQVAQKPLQPMNSYIYMCKNHPLSKQQIVPADFAAYPTVLLHAPGYNEFSSNIERMLHAYKVTPNIVARVQHPDAVMHIVANSQLLHPSIGLYKGLHSPAIEYQVAMLNGAPVIFDLSFFHHYRHSNNPLHQWLYKQISEIVKLMDED